MSKWVNQPYVDKLFIEATKMRVIKEMRSKKVLEKLSKIMMAMLEQEYVEGFEIRTAKIPSDENPITDGYKVLVRFKNDLDYTCEMIIPVIELETDFDSTGFIIATLRDGIAKYLNQKV